MSLRSSKGFVQEATASQKKIKSFTTPAGLTFIIWHIPLNAEPFSSLSRIFLNDEHLNSQNIQLSSPTIILLEFSFQKHYFNLSFQIFREKTYIPNLLQILSFTQFFLVISFFLCLFSFPFFYIYFLHFDQLFNDNFIYSIKFKLLSNLISFNY